MDSRKSHWPIYDVVPIELIETVAEAVREASRETVVNKESKGGMVVYFSKARVQKEDRGTL